jgi:hypothetical protein
METITRDVRDLPEAERSSLERLVGHPLRDTQRIILQIMNLPTTSLSEPKPDGADNVPGWWNIYEGLDDADIDRLDEAVCQRADLTRSFA